MSRGATLCECGDHAFGVLTKGYVVLVSCQDAHFLESASYYAFVNRVHVYAETSRHVDGIQTNAYLHREITGAPRGLVVDHKNRNSLDNRRENLRVCTNAENVRNSRKRKVSSLQYKGVVKHGKKRFGAVIRKDGVIYRLGSFDTQEAAHAAYVEKARELHGEFARAA